MQPPNESYEGKPRHSTIFISHLHQGHSSAGSVGVSLRPWGCITRLFGLPLPPLSHTHSILISQDQKDFRFFSSQTPPTVGMPSPAGGSEPPPPAAPGQFSIISVLPDRARKSAFPWLLLPARGLSFGSLGENKAAVLLTIYSFICSFAQQVFVCVPFQVLGYSSKQNRTPALRELLFWSGEIDNKQTVKIYKEIKQVRR